VPRATEYREEDGRFLLIPRSSRPEFRPIDYPGPDVEQSPTDETIQVIGFVIAAYPLRTLDLMRRMGLLRPLIQK
jgi:hypothetical protein